MIKGWEWRHNDHRRKPSLHATLIAVKREEHHPVPMARFTEPPPLKEDATEVAKMRHLLLTMAGRAIYAKRKCTVEPVFGIIKAILGFRQFSLRGLENVTGQTSLRQFQNHLAFRRLAVPRPHSAVLFLAPIFDPILV
jgi:hypothetical protein